MMKKILSLYLPWLFWMALIFYLSSIPDLRITEEDLWDLILRKIAHMAVFGLLFLLSWRISIKQRLSRPYLWAILWTVAYAICDEFHQFFVPTRIASEIDVLIDSLGIFLALTVLLLVPWLRSYLKKV